MLSIEELRRWCKSKKPGFVTKSFLRTMGFDDRTHRQWLRGIRPMPLAMQRLLSHFVEDWEAGLLEFVTVSRKGTKGRRGGHISVLRHRTTPRPMPIRMTVHFDGGRPALRFLGKPERLRMPSFPDIAGPLKKG